MNFKCIFAESEIRESKSQVESNWNFCREMIEKMGRNSEQKTFEKADLEFATKFEDMKKKIISIGKSNTSYLLIGMRYI